MVETITLKEVYPPSGHVQRLYCGVCEGHLDLAFADYRNIVSGVDISVKDLPVLRCENCSKDYLPDHSRFAIIRHHELATLRGSNAVRATRKPLEKTFPLAKVPFLYDADDYYYIPGLSREWDDGFLTPVFFNKKVLLKYDADPAYKVSFASTTYGTIDMESAYISFGINKNGKVVMWLGDIAKLPEPEQYYLRSENVPSDHSIGCEFYDGQIECIYTPLSREQTLFAARSAFFEACAAKFGIKIAYLDAEVLDLALGFNGPVIDSEQTRKQAADTLNRIYVESIDNGALGSIMTRAGLDPKNLGGLKRLQAALGTLALGGELASLLSPFFVLYDLRVAYSHLGSADSTVARLKTVTDRLGLEDGAGLLAIYDALVAALTASLETLTALVKSASGVSET